MQSQQRKFNTFINDYNNEKGQGGIGDKLPSSVYTLSPRDFSQIENEWVYPDYFIKRKVGKCGGFKWNHKRVPISQTLEYEYIGLEEIDDGEWKVYFHDYFLGIFKEKLMRIEDKPHNYQRRV